MPGTLPIEFGVYTASAADALVELLADAFVADPPNIALGITRADFDALVRLFAPKAADEGLTIVARSADTGQLIGALLAEDSAAPSPAGFDRLSPKFHPIFDILARLNAEYRRGRATGTGESLHLFLLGVDARFAGRGIARRLVSESLAHAATRGYRVAVAEATNRRSQHVFRSLGFAERARRSYRDYRFEGQACFASIADEGGPILMDRPLVSA